MKSDLFAVTTPKFIPLPFPTVDGLACYALTTASGSFDSHFTSSVLNESYFLTSSGFLPSEIA